MKTYGCRKRDLLNLDSTVLYYPGRKRVRFYLGAEVEWLIEEQDYRVRRDEKRRRQLELRFLGIRLRKINPVLRVFMIGDYLHVPGPVTTTLDVIKERFAVLDRVKKIKNVDELAHPGALFEFCIQYPNGTADDFAELKKKAEMVCRLEGDRIMSHLTKSEIDSLLDTPLKDVAESIHTRNKKFAIVRAQLEKEVGTEVAQEIMQHPACQFRIEHEDDGLVLAHKLSRFWREKNDKEKRRKRVANVLRQRGLSELSFSHAKMMYVKGEIDCDPEEIVGLHEIARNAEIKFIRHRAERVSIAVTKFEECLHSKGMTYEESIREAVDFAKRVPLPERYHVRGTWDYKQLASGFWSDKWK